MNYTICPQFYIMKMIYLKRKNSYNLDIFAWNDKSVTVQP